MRRPHKIKAWLADRQMTQTEIARRLGVQRQQVCDTINSRKNHRRVLIYLYKAGCPVEHLGLPAYLVELLEARHAA